MKRFIFPIVALCIWALPMVAQASNETSSSTSAGVANSGADSGANASFYGGASTSVYPQNTPAPTAPPFVTASPCMGVISGAGTSPVVGIALGMSYKDKECELRANASALNSLGARMAALQIMCQLPDVKQAMTAAGTPCSSVTRAEASPVHPMDQTEFQPTGTGYVQANGGIAPVKICKQVFVPPANPDGAGYMDQRCTE